MAAKRELNRPEFDALTKQLLSRARAGSSLTPVPADAAEDVVQEVWTRLVSRSPDLPRSEDLAGHANATLRDAVADYWRSRTRKKDIPVDNVIPLDGLAEESEPAAPSRQVLAKIEAGRLREILVSIVGPRAAAYAVLDALGFTEAEIAYQLGVSVQEAGTLRKQVSRSRAAVATALGKHQRKETEAK